jgi:hypothetical protein
VQRAAEGLSWPFSPSVRLDPAGPWGDGDRPMMVCADSHRGYCQSSIQDPTGSGARLGCTVACTASAKRCSHAGSSGQAPADQLENETERCPAADGALLGKCPGARGVPTAPLR